MARRRGFDQATAWISAVMLTGAVFGIMAGLFSWQANEIKAPPYEPVKVLNDVEESDKPSTTKLAAKSLDPKVLKKMNMHWGYTGETGPTYWGDLDRKNTACVAGKMQSPIDIGYGNRSKDMQPIEFRYEAFVGKIWNNGRTIQVDVPDGNFANINGERYYLKNFHFHAPSEHRVEGIPYDMEVHLLHQSEKGKIAKVAILVEETQRDHPALARIWKNLPKADEPTRDTVSFNVKDLFPRSHHYYHYKGSMTAPPCTEGVDWYVLSKPVRFSARQIDNFIRVIKYNARPVQPLYSRELMIRWKS